MIRRYDALLDGKVVGSVLPASEGAWIPVEHPRPYVLLHLTLQGRTPYPSLWQAQYALEDKIGEPLSWELVEEAALDY